MSFPIIFPSGMEDSRRCLFDAGCRNEAIEKYLKCEEEGNRRAMLDILSQERENILTSVHRQEEQIANIDWIVHQIESDKGETDGKN